MERGMNLNDPRLKKYLESLEPKHREMLEKTQQERDPQTGVQKVKNRLMHKDKKTMFEEGFD
jgi:hypothetical protein